MDHLSDTGEEDTEGVTAKEEEGAENVTVKEEARENEKETLVP